MIHSILYISSAVPELTKKDIDEIMTVTYENNSEKNISGFLVFNRGNFLQLLEGDEKHIRGVFNRIVADLRHRNIITVLDQQSSTTSFNYYHSGFKICDNPLLVEELKNYVNIVKTIKEPELSKTFNLVDGILNSM